MLYIYTGQFAGSLCHLLLVVLGTSSLYIFISFVWVAERGVKHWMQFVILRKERIEKLFHFLIKIQQQKLLRLVWLMCKNKIL